MTGLMQMKYLVEAQGLDIDVIRFTLRAAVSDGDRDGLSATAPALQHIKQRAEWTDQYLQMTNILCHW